MNRIADLGFRIANSNLQTADASIIPQSAIRNPKSKGFTLIEVLLSVAILASVVAVVYASFSTAGQSVEAAEAVRAETDIARTLLSRLSDDIANAYLRGFGTLGGFVGKKEEVEIDGAKRRIDSLSLTTLTNWRRPETKEMELWEVGYLFKEKVEGKGYALFRREKRELSKDAPFPEGGDEFELTDRVEQLQMRYHDGSKWMDEWSNRNMLPKRVEIVLILGGDKVYITEVDVKNLAL